MHKIYNYDQATGVFTYKVARGPMRVGAEAGTINADGYVVMRLNGKQEYGHRLAFLYMTGQWPEKFIDHKDTDRVNNRWENLREVELTINNRNKSEHKNNTSGHVGVSWDSARGLWTANIGVEGKLVRLGRFQSFDEAVYARMQAELNNLKDMIDAKSRALKEMQEKFNIAP